MDPSKALRLFLKDKVRHSNVIIDLLENLQTKKITTVQQAILALQKIFCQLLQDGDIKATKNIAESSMNAKEIYQLWLEKRYNEFYVELQSLFTHRSFQIQELAMNVYIQLMQTEGFNSITSVQSSKIIFPIARHKSFIQYLLSKSVSFGVLIKKILSEYMLCPDFTFYTLQVLSSVMKSWRVTHSTTTSTANFFSFLELVNLPEEEKKPLVPAKNFLDQDSELSEKSYGFNFSYKQARVLFNGIWGGVLEWDLPENLRKKCLVLLPERVMMHLNDPVPLTDFFMNAYNAGGPSSIMALHGVFILISEYNMEYPDFYKKLYALFEPTIFHARYKARFFILCNKFLSSSLLPEYYLAAFLKKICRMMLIAPSSSLVMLLKFTANLLVRYPSLQRLLHSIDATCLEDDPYNEDEPDPAFCHAGESSLWEIATLRHHPLPGISKAANFIWRNLPDVENNLAKHLEITSDDLYHRASSINIPEVEVVFMKPGALCYHPDEEISSDWAPI